MLDNQDRAFNTVSSAQFLKGKLVYDADNAKVGIISAVDAQAGYFVAQKGVLFPHDLYIPLSAIATTNPAGVVLHLTKETLKDPRFAVAPTTDTAANSARPTASTDTAANSARPTAQPKDTAPLSGSNTQVEDITVPIREETLLASKVAEKIGEVHVRRYIVEEDQSIVAPITHEEISIEHVVVTNQPTGADAFTEKDINLPVMAERLIVGKETHVVEEVHIYKHQVTEQQQSAGMLRKEHLKVDGDVQVKYHTRDTPSTGDPSQQDRSSRS